jgi:polar amino acid transport system permease protein
MAEKPKTRPGGGRLFYIPGGETITRLDPWWGLVILVVVAAVVLITVWSDPFWNILVFVRGGIFITVEVTVISFFFIMILGLLGGLGRLSRNWFLRGIASLYVEIVRGVPLLVQLIWWYFAFPVLIQTVGKWLDLSFMIEFQANAIVTAIIGLTVCYGAYMTEIYRAGIQSIPKGQMEAARSLGMTHFQAMRHIILPQSVRVILPPVGNEFIALLKDTSLVSVVAVADLTRRGREFMAVHFNPIEVWTMVALIYLVMTLLSARGLSWLERKSRFED